MGDLECTQQEKVVTIDEPLAALMADASTMKVGATDSACTKT